MKTIGILGGMSWESSLSYYQLLNQGIKQAMGGLHSAKINLVSVDFAEIEVLQHRGDWDALADKMVAGALAVQASGADFLLIATNTMHKLAPQVVNALDIPLLHIADATAQCLRKDQIRRVGLLGTRFTMEQDFYAGRLREHQLEVLVPDEHGMALVHDIIYQELCQGMISAASRAIYLQQIEALHARGAEAIILGCTEIGLLVKQQDTAIKLYDTTALHVAAAVEFALEE
ncbi:MULTISPECIES: aspartate/glutamate racemase family protein [unclassified Agarivorans]|uniref:aspartate/glutamate racemase family protein n=1 Tax=unclassified Agarivorans TaxID=2636026 RepID=UPI003D7D9908